MWPHQVGRALFVALVPSLVPPPPSRCAAPSPWLSVAAAAVPPYGAVLEPWDGLPTWGWGSSGSPWVLDDKAHVSSRVAVSDSEPSVQAGRLALSLEGQYGADGMRSKSPFVPPPRSSSFCAQTSIPLTASPTLSYYAGITLFSASPHSSTNPMPVPAIAFNPNVGVVRWTDPGQDWTFAPCDQGSVPSTVSGVWLRLICHRGDSPSCDMLFSYSDPATQDGASALTKHDAPALVPCSFLQRNLSHQHPTVAGWPDMAYCGTFNVGPALGEFSGIGLTVFRSVAGPAPIEARFEDFVVWPGAWGCAGQAPDLLSLSLPPVPLRYNYTADPALQLHLAFTPAQLPGPLPPEWDATRAAWLDSSGNGRDCALDACSSDCEPGQSDGVWFFHPVTTTTSPAAITCTGRAPIVDGTAGWTVAVAFLPAAGGTYPRTVWAQGSNSSCSGMQIGLVLISQTEARFRGISGTGPAVAFCEATVPLFPFFYPVVLTLVLPPGATDVQVYRNGHRIDIINQKHYSQCNWNELAGLADQYSLGVDPCEVGVDPSKWLKADISGVIALSRALSEDEVRDMSTVLLAKQQTTLLEVSTSIMLHPYAVAYSMMASLHGIAFAPISHLCTQDSTWHHFDLSVLPETSLLDISAPQCDGAPVAMHWNKQSAFAKMSIPIIRSSFSLSFCLQVPPGGSSSSEIASTVLWQLGGDLTDPVAGFRDNLVWFGFNAEGHLTVGNRYAAPVPGLSGQTPVVNNTMELMSDPLGEGFHHFYLSVSGEQGYLYAQVDGQGTIQVGKWDGNLDLTTGTPYFLLCPLTLWRCQVVMPSFKFWTGEGEHGAIEQDLRECTCTLPTGLPQPSFAMNSAPTPLLTPTQPWGCTEGTEGLLCMECAPKGHCRTCNSPAELDPISDRCYFPEAKPPDQNTMLWLSLISGDGGSAAVSFQLMQDPRKCTAAESTGGAQDILTDVPESG
eukprot:gene9174-1649_t